MSEPSQFAYNSSYRPTLSMLQLCLGQGTGQKPCKHLLVLVAMAKEVSTMTWPFPHLKGHRELDSPLFHHILKGVCVTHGVIFWGENQGWNNQGAVFEEVHACIKGTHCGLVGDKKIHSGNWNGLLTEWSPIGWCPLLSHSSCDPRNQPSNCQRLRRGPYWISRFSSLASHLSALNKLCSCMLL